MRPQPLAAFGATGRLHRLDRAARFASAYPVDAARPTIAVGLGRPPTPKAKLLQAALAMLSKNSQPGGLSGLTTRSQQAGRGDVIGSWIGTGQTLPISAEQIQQVLGEGHLQQVSEETGLPQEETARH